METSQPATPTMTYRLDCNDCSFQTVMDVDVDAVFDVIEEHQEANEEDPSDHFVDFERVTDAIGS